MAISKDLFLAVLSMNAYNRGYGAGLAAGGPLDKDGLGCLSSQLGNATVINQNISAAAQSASFYALSYELQSGEQIDGLVAGQTIISYRGTDDYWRELPWVDFPIFAQADYDEQQIYLT